MVNGEIGSEIVEIERITAGGKALYRGSTGVGFAPAGIFVPGDFARITSSKHSGKKSFSYELLKPSPLRRNASCAYAGVCGGCDLLNVSAETQLEIKKGILEESFRRIGKFQPASLPDLRTWQSSAKGYRNRVQFQLRDGRPGFLGRASNSFVEIETCIVCDDSINSVFASGKLRNLPDGQYQALSKGADEPALVRLGNNVPGRREAMEVSGFASSKIFEFDSGQLVAHAGHFFQSNLAGLGELRRLVREISERIAGRLARPAGTGLRALELYAGRGVLGSALSEKVTWIEGTEIDASGTGTSSAYGERGRLSACDYKKLDGRSTRSLFGGAWDLALADPPRSGLDRQVVDLFEQIRPRFLILVFCDPVSAARDCAALVVLGYEIIRMDLLDFYPGVSHFETLVVMELPERGGDKS